MNSLTPIKENEHFIPENYPSTVHELTTLIDGISHIPIYYKVEIIVSYLKNHSLNIDWIDANPALTRLITSGFFKTSHLESLFESCRHNIVFLKEYEEYLSRQLLMRRN